MADRISDILEQLEIPNPFRRCGLCGTVHDTEQSWQEHGERMDKLVARERALAAEEHAVRQRQRLLAQGAPRELLDTPLERWPAVTALAHSLARPGFRVVSLAGGVGSGKTMAALHWLLHVRGRPYFKTARNLAALPPWSLEYESADACVIDDVGMEGESEQMRTAFLDHFDNLVAHYHGAGKRLVLTTNLGMERFKSLYKARVASRFRQRGDWISLDLGDQRKPKNHGQAT